MRYWRQFGRLTSTTAPLLLLPLNLAGQARDCIGSSSADPALQLVLESQRVAATVGAAPVPDLLVRRQRVSGCQPRWLAPTALSDAQFRLEPVTLGAGFASGYPVDRNNGALWQGRGVTMGAQGGVSFSWGPIDAVLRPVLGWEQNTDFPVVDTIIAGYDPFTYPWLNRRIDWPQRMGDESFGFVSAGQSRVGLVIDRVRAGVSTENLWWGPGLRQSILMTNSAEGFPHLYVGTARTLDVYIGRLGGELIWGRLRESEHFDTVSQNNTRLFAGLNIVFQPEFFDGLQLGLGRVYVRTRPPEGLEARDFFPFFDAFLKTRVFDGDQTADDVADQLISLWGLWTFPGVGLQMYGEWARNDHSWDVNDLIAEPDHTQAYLLGLEKVDAVRSGQLRFSAELIHLGSSRTMIRRPGQPYYVHGIVRQGYTHRGQLLGASIGPGSDAQYLGADYWQDGGMAGLWLERVRYNDDAYYDQITNFFAFHARDVELTGGIRGARRFGPFLASGSLSYSSRRNRLFRHCNPNLRTGQRCFGSAFRDGNLHIPLQITWFPPH